MSQITQNKNRASVHAPVIYSKRQHGMIDRIGSRSHRRCSLMSGYTQNSKIHKKNPRIRGPSRDRNENSFAGFNTRRNSLMNNTSRAVKGASVICIMRGYYSDPDAIASFFALFYIYIYDMYFFYLL